jgi:hypothetical protein
VRKKKTGVFVRRRVPVLRSGRRRAGRAHYLFIYLSRNTLIYVPESHADLSANASPAAAAARDARGQPMRRSC